MYFDILFIILRYIKTQLDSINIIYNLKAVKN